MKKRIFKFFTVFLLIFSLLLPIVTKADTIAAKNYITQATYQKSFFYYNKAYEEIMKLQDGNEKNILLGQLAAITGDIWTEDIKNILEMIVQLSETGSGRLYNQIEAQINGSKIHEIDKAYFLGELTSWGRQLVFTEDYVDALANLISLYVHIENKPIDNSFKQAVGYAEVAISKIKNQYSREYLHEELNNLKKLVGIPISDKVTEYVGDEEKIVTIDNASPKQNSTVNITVKGKEGATVNLLVRYKTTSTNYTGTIDKNGKVTIPVNIGRATIGYTVNVDVTILYSGTITSEHIYFTPIQ